MLFHLEITVCRMSRYVNMVVVVSSGASRMEEGDKLRIFGRGSRDSVRSRPS